MASAPHEPNGSQLPLSAKPPFLRRVQIRGYKSIDFCDVTLAPMTILVGRNASGKSNFLDALAFVSDILSTNLTEATQRHGGWKSILSTSSGDGKIAFDMEFGLSHPSESLVRFGFVLREGPFDAPIRIKEWFQCFESNHTPICNYDLRGSFDSMSVQTAFEWTFSHPSIACANVPTPRPDGLWLGTFGKEPFLEVSDGLRYSGHYNFQPEIIRQPHKGSNGAILATDGRNLASSIANLTKFDPGTLGRVEKYLNAVVNEIDGISVVKGDYDTIRFRLKSLISGTPVEFDASSMSDGTLRVLASLTAAFQLHRPSGPAVVGIEEPETALHPAAMRALVAAMDEATLRTQIILTTHSPELLDAPEVKPVNIRVVQMIDGKTVIGPVDEVSTSIVRDHLSTLGGLVRERHLEPDIDDLDRQAKLAAQERSH